MFESYRPSSSTYGWSRAELPPNRMPFPGLASASDARPSSHTASRVRPTLVSPFTIASVSSVVVARVHRSNHRRRVERRRRGTALRDVLPWQTLGLLDLDRRLSVHEVGELPEADVRLPSHAHDLVGRDRHAGELGVGGGGVLLPDRVRQRLVRLRRHLGEALHLRELRVQAVELADVLLDPRLVGPARHPIDALPDGLEPLIGQLQL